MADAKSLFEEGQDVTDVFESGQEIVDAPSEDTSYQPELKEYSRREAFGLGGEGLPSGIPQGLSLGFGDEIGALFGALGAKSGGDERDFGDVYGNIRDVLREEAGAAQEQQPVAAISGELIGGLAVPLGMGGAAAKTGATAVNIGKGRAIAQAAKAAGKSVPDALKQARTLSSLEKILQMGKTGAQAGAIAGLGTSKADLTQATSSDVVDLGKSAADMIPFVNIETAERNPLREASKDVLINSALGAGIGSGAQAIGTGLKKSVDVVKTLPYVDDALRIRELTKQGYAIADQAKNISQEARDQAYKILEKLETLRTFTGSLVGKSKEEADKIVGKVNLGDVVEQIRNEINTLKPVGRAEKEDVANVHQVLSDILEETEKVSYKYIPKGKLPKQSIAQKAEQKIAKKTAEAQAKDQIKLGELYDALQKTADPDEAEGIIAQIRKIESGDTSFPPENILEETTGLPVLGVSRGPKKAPLVEAITPEAEEVFTPIQRVEVNRQVVPGKAEYTPGEITSHLQSLSDVPVETSKGQRAIGMAKEKITAARQQAAEATGEEGKQALDLLKETSKGFGSIKDIQKSLGLPDTGLKGINPGQEKNIVDNLQRAILGLTENKISSDRFMEITKELADQFPQAGQEIRDAARSISERYQLSKTLSSQSLEGVKRGGLAVPAMIGRATEAATRAEQAVKGTAQKIVKSASQELVDLGKKVYDSSPDTIQMLADKAAAKGTTFGTNTAKVLNSLVNAPQAKRKAMLFTLMQQPDFREFTKEFLGVEEGQ